MKELPNCTESGFYHNIFNGYYDSENNMRCPECHQIIGMEVLDKVKMK